MEGRQKGKTDNKKSKPPAKKPGGAYRYRKEGGKKGKKEKKGTMGFGPTVQKAENTLELGSHSYRGDALSP